jgi:hypothetical protein
MEKPRAIFITCFVGISLATIALMVYFFGAKGGGVVKRDTPTYLHNGLSRDYRSDIDTIVDGDTLPKYAHRSRVFRDSIMKAGTDAIDNWGKAHQFNRAGKRDSAEYYWAKFEKARMR